LPSTCRTKKKNHTQFSSEKVQAFPADALSEIKKQQQQQKLIWLKGEKMSGPLKMYFPNNQCPQFKNFSLESINTSTLWPGLSILSFKQNKFPSMYYVCIKH